MRGFLTSMQNFWTSLTNSMSITSTIVCAISATLVFCGHTFWLKQHDADLLFWFFCSSGALMVVYAVAYGLYANLAKEFDGGLVSARRVMCFIALITSASFLYVGVQLQVDPNLSTGQKFAGLLLGPVIMVVFAVAYGMYVHSVAMDQKWRASLDANSLRRGPAINTIRLLKFATCAALLYCAARAGYALDGYGILCYLISLIVALLGCTAVEVCFVKAVSPVLDRGLKASAPVVAPSAAGTS